MSADRKRAALVSRAATAADVPALLELVHAAYRGGPDVAGWTTEAHLLGGLRADPDMVLEMITGPGSQIRMFLADDDLLACCQLDVTGGTGYVGFFAVLPSRQGGGVGSAVLAEVERLAVEAGCHRMRMTVLSARTELIAYYERRGYRRTGATEPFPYGDERFGTPRRPDLEFAELVKPLAG